MAEPGAENLSFRASIRRYLPPWLRDRPTLGKTTGYRLAASWACLLDATMQLAIEGLLSGMPRQGTASALPLHGRDRRLVRGPEQSAEDFAEQLTRWLSYLRKAGNAWSVMATLQRYFAPASPVLRVVTRSGFWSTLHADGSMSFAHGTAWDWDSVTHPERADEWWWIWVIVYDPFPDAGAWGDDDLDTWTAAKVFGHETSAANAAAIKALLEQFKGAHAHVTLIVAYDPDSFDPAEPSTFPTDGLWGRWGKVVDGAAVPARVDTARYWRIS